MIAIIVIEDDPVTRVGITQVLAREAGIKVVAAIPTVDEFVPARWGEDLDLVMLDLRLRNSTLEGPDAVRHIAAMGLPVLVMSMFSEEDPVLEAIEAGAKGYLPKDVEPDEVIRAVEAVANGRSYVAPTVAGFLLRRSTSLSHREREVLRLVAGGETDNDIAKMLGISLKTVNGHVDRIRDKTGQRRRAHLTRYAIERGILPRFRRKT